MKIIALLALFFLRQGSRCISLSRKNISRHSRGPRTRPTDSTGDTVEHNEPWTQKAATRTGKIVGPKYNALTGPFYIEGAKHGELWSSTWTGQAEQQRRAGFNSDLRCSDHSA